MNKSGFTLIEILCTIAIIGIIATMTSFNIINFINTNNDTTEETKEKIITTAAQVYIELDQNKDLKETCFTTGCNITTDTLINAGLISKEDVDNKEVINIKKENQKIKCTIK